VEREPEAKPDDDDLDLFGDPDDIEEPIEEQVDKRLQEEREGD
jgi:hypothetical protein